MQLQHFSGERLNFHEMQPYYSFGFIWCFSCYEISSFSKHTCSFLIDMGSLGTISQGGKGHICDFVHWLHKKHHQQELFFEVLLWGFFVKIILMATLSF